jgi:hypothetical protein
MNGYFAGGLTDGFLQGLGAVMQYQNMLHEQKRQSTLDQQSADYRERQAGLADVELQLKREQLAQEQANKDRTAGFEQQRIDVLKGGLGLSTVQQQQQNQIARQQLELQQRESARQDQAQAAQNWQDRFKQQQLQRQEGLKLAQTQIYPKIAAGTLTPDDVANWKRYTGLDLADLTDDHLVDNAVHLFHGLKTGQVPMNDPRLNAVASRLYGGMLQRNIGDKVRVRDEQGNPTGPEITVTNKSWAGAYPTTDGKFGLNTWVEGMDDKGQTHKYLAPVTLNGMGGDDPIVAFSGDDLEKPLVASMYFNHEFNSNPQLKANIQRVLNGG